MPWPEASAHAASLAAACGTHTKTLQPTSYASPIFLNLSSAPGSLLTSCNAMSQVCWDENRPYKPQPLGHSRQNSLCLYAKHIESILMSGIEKANWPSQCGVCGPLNSQGDTS